MSRDMSVLRWSVWNGRSCRFGPARVPNRLSTVLGERFVEALSSHGGEAVGVAQVPPSSAVEDASSGLVAAPGSLEVVRAAPAEDVDVVAVDLAGGSPAEIRRRGDRPC